MEHFVEKKRERRIRDFRRMVARGYRIAKRFWTTPAPHNPHDEPPTWAEVYRRRWHHARKYANHLKYCSCSLGCGNSRRIWGDRTNQEYRESMRAIDQLVEMGYLDEGPAQYHVWRRRPWV